MDFQKTGGVAAEKVKEKVEQRRKSIVSKFSLGHFSILSFVSPPPLVILPDSKECQSRFNYRVLVHKKYIVLLKVLAILEFQALIEVTLNFSGAFFHTFF